MVSRKKRVLSEKELSFSTSFIAGAVSGLVVDAALFPLDTIKTRLQSQYGFWKSGGFKGMYKGIGPTIIGSAPCSALFFSTYNTFKYNFQPLVDHHQEFLVHMTGAAVAEVVSCVVRVPTEIVKQRRQAGIRQATSLSIVSNTLKNEGIVGLYRGYWTTVLRDAPFSIIQFPLWELFKSYVRRLRSSNEVTPIEGAICGAVSGAIAGGLTTPLDVVKTRIMLSENVKGDVEVMPIILNIYKQSGIKGFFAGFLPRVTWIFLGGAVYFGVYEKACILLEGESGPFEHLNES